MQLGKCPGSILPQPSENKDRVNKLAQIFGTKGIDGPNVEGLGKKVSILRVTSYGQPTALIPSEASPHERRLKSDTISVQEADNTFITSYGTSPYNSTWKWAVKRHYREDNN